MNPETKTTDYASRIAAGIAFLNEHRPNWREKVTAGNVRVEDPNACPLGLTYGFSYHSVLLYLRDVGVIASGIHRLDKWAADHGFFVIEDLHDDSDEEWNAAVEEWEGLQTAWVTELQRDPSKAPAE